MTALLDAGRVPMLAWRNLVHDRVRFGVTVIGIAFSVFLMTFQGGLFVGFLKAAGKLVDATGADLWISARGVPCFDFASPLPRRFASLAAGVKGVAGIDMVAVGWVSWKGPEGSPRSVGVIGSNPSPTSGVPLPFAQHGQQAVLPESVVVDETSLGNLGLDRPDVDVELAGYRARVTGFVTGFGSFLGTPYVFTAHEDAVRYLRLGPEHTSFLAVRLEPGADASETLALLRRRLPEADVHTRADFGAQSGAFWMAQTGAGGGIALAGLLGLVVGAVIVSQTVYATTMENIEEFATLKAMGATANYVRRIVLAQSLASGVLGAALGILGAIPATALARAHVVSWLATPPWLALLTSTLCLCMCAVASLSAIHAALSVDPARVFRA